VIRGERAAPPRDGVYLEFVEEDRPKMPLFANTWRGFRTERYKYTVLDGKPWHLFDLREDPYELHNLVTEPACRSLRDRLHEALRRRAEETADQVVGLEEV